jgi:hypothetical protein
MGLLSKLDFFGKIFQDKIFGQMSHRDIYLKLFSNLRLQVYKPGDFIYKVCKPTNFKVYILLKGNIGVYQSWNPAGLSILDTKDCAQQNFPKPKLESFMAKFEKFLGGRDSQSAPSGIARNPVDGIIKNEQASGMITTEFIYEKISSFVNYKAGFVQPGLSFGENGIMEGFKRTETMLAYNDSPRDEDQQDCIFLIVLKKREFGLIWNLLEFENIEKNE